MLKVRNRILRVGLKTLLYAGVAILFLFVSLSVYIEVNKKELLSDFKDQLGKKINGKISYTNADISVWKSFPFIGLHLSNAVLADSINIPLVKMKDISFSVSVFQVFGKGTKLHNVSLRSGFIHLFTDSSGYSNKYLLESKSKTDQQKNSIEINSIAAENVRMLIENRQKGKRFDILFREMDADISTAGEIIKINVDQKSFIYGLGFNLAKGSFLKKQLFEGFTRLRFDKKKSLLSFGKTSVKVDGQPYTIKADFWLKAPGYFKMDIETKQAPFENIRNIFAENTFDDMQNIRVEKPFDITARLEGSLAYKTIPKLVANWVIKNNTIIVPAATITDCSFKGRFTNEITNGLPLTDENSGITANDFSGNWDGIQLKGDNISIKNLVNPYADMGLQSSTDLRSLNEKLGLRTIRFLGGNATLNFSYHGPLQEDVSIIDKVNGNLRFSNGIIKYIPRNFTFTNCSGDITFSSDALQANDLKFDLQSNHFNVDLAGANLSALSSSDPGKAIIQCNVSTPKLDLAQLRSIFAAKKTMAAGSKATGKVFSATTRIDEALDHGELRLILNAGMVQYNDFIGKDLKGAITFSNSDLLISGVSINHADGNMVIDAKIIQSTSVHATSAKVKLNNVDVSKVFRAFNNFGQDGISYENLNGRLNANTNISMLMNNEGKVVPGTMKGTVEFSLKNGALVNFEPMQNIKGFVFKDKDMSNVGFAELKNKLEIDNYKIRIPKMEIQSTAIGMFVEGVYDLKKTDSKFDIQVPLKGLKKRDSSYVPENIGVNAKAGTSIYLEGKNDKTGKVKIGLNTTRTLRKLF